MAILTVRDLVLALGHPPLLDGISFQLDAGERVCLVGRNGAGKSTLLHLLSGEATPDSGSVVPASGLRIGRLPQEVPREAEGSVFHAVASGLGELGQLVERYHALADRVATGDSAALAQLERCQQELEAAGGWEVNQQVETVLSRLQLDPYAHVGDLSGGIRRRVLLARALVSAPDLLLLDEPTNHLDIEAITWLESFLRAWPGSLLFISHDRTFCQRLATRVIELDRGKLTDFRCDYETYLQRKEALLEAEEQQKALFDKRLAQEEVWIRQGIKARRTRNQGRVRALERMREERAQRRDRSGQARIAVQEAQRSGKIVVEAEAVDFAYDDRTIIRNLNTTILRGDKVGIIGPNGSGKSTLLRLLLGDLEPTRGRIHRGTNLQPAYFDQYRATLDEDRTVQENIGQGRDVVTVNGKDRHVLSYLKDFLFPPDRARQPVSALSGGERNRLLLARLFTRPANLLVLDEPTNDLDADTLELLEERLMEYQGTVLVVSHDRSFLNNLVTSSLVFEGDGQVNEYVGGYDDWLRQRPQASPASGSPGKTRQSGEQRPRTPSRRLSYNDRRELEQLPERIEELEAQRDALHSQLADPQLYQQDGSAAARIQAELAGVDKALEDAYARWEQLEASQG